MLFLYLNMLEDEGQRIQFEDLYMRYRKQMLLLAKSFLHNDADAEDVVHDVFFRIASRHMPFIQGLNHKEDIRNYLLKATKNTALNELKKKHRTHLSIADITQHNREKELDISDEAFTEQIFAKTEYEDILQALLSLEDPYREIMYYHFVLEMSIPEAARCLGRKPDTAKKQLVRGKKLLLSKLGMKGELYVYNKSRI